MTLVGELSIGQRLHQESQVSPYFSARILAGSSAKGDHHG